MNKTTKVLSISVAMFAMVGLVGALNSQAFANPPGAPDGKLAYKFNYIAHPGTNDGLNNDNNSGHRVFTLDGANSPQHIIWTLDPQVSGPTIIDHLTEAMSDDGSPATAVADAADKYIVYVKINGPNKDGNTLYVCRTVTDDDGNLLCEVGDVDLSKKNGVDRYTFPKKLFDEGSPEYWHLEQGTGFKVAEFRLYEVTP